MSCFWRIRALLSYSLIVTTLLCLCPYSGASHSCQFFLFSMPAHDLRDPPLQTSHGHWTCFLSHHPHDSHVCHSSSQSSRRLHHRGRYLHNVAVRLTRCASASGECQGLPGSPSRSWSLGECLRLRDHGQMMLSFRHQC